MVNFSTRYGNQIDCFLTNITRLKCFKHSPIGKSDHCVITCKKDNINKKPNVSTAQVPDYSPANRQLFFDILSSTDFSLTSNDIDDNWNIFVTRLSYLHSLCFPKKTIRVYINQKCPWINNNIRILIRKRDIAYKRKQTNIYKHFKIKVRNEIQKAKSTYLSNITQLQKKREWNKIKQYLGIENLKSYEIPDVNKLNNYFASVYVKDNNINQINKSSLTSCNLKVDSNEVLKYLKSSKKQGGFPYITSFILREFASILYEPLTHLINDSLNSGIVPKVLKHSVICPVPKVPKPKDVSHFRPITSPSPILKIIEKIVQKNWIDPLIVKNQHEFDDQFAFLPLPARGCQSALTLLYTKIAQLVDKKHYVCTVLIDFSKAFDKATKSNIIYSLSTFGASINLVNWVTSYLSDRKHKVISGNQESNFIDAISGTPQGGIISPILFAILLSSLKPTQSNSTFIKYADDLTLISWSKNLTQLKYICQQEINHILTWSKQHQMEINADKTKAILHGGRRSTDIPALFINDNQLKFVKTAKILGIYISDNLKWNTQINNVLNDASKRIFYLQLLRRSGCHKQIMTKFYDSFIRQKITYAFPSMCNMPDVLFQKLKKFEKRCFYIINCKHIRPIEDICYKNCLNLCKKVIEIEDHPLRQLFIKIENERTRRKIQLIAPAGQSTQYIKSFVRFFL